MITVNSLNDLDGAEIRPQVFLIGTPAFHEPSQKWRSLANAFGSLVLVELSVKPVPAKEGD